MTTADEGSYKCLALTLDGPSAGGRVQLLTAMTPAEPRLFVNGKQTLPMASKKSSAKRRIETGRRTGDHAYRSWISSSSHLKGAVRTWTGPVTPGSKTMTVYSSVTHSVKIELVTEAVYGCQLKPHPMFAHLNITYGVKSDPIRVLYTVRRIELQPYRDNYFHGDRIDCLAKGPAGAKNPMDKNSRRRAAAGERVEFVPAAGGAKVGYYAYTCSASNRDHCGRPDHRGAAAPAVGGPGVPTKVKHWCAATTAASPCSFITFGVICGFALIAVVFALSVLHRLQQQHRLRPAEGQSRRIGCAFYGDNGRGNGGAYCDTSDEEEL
uniref:Ig-like domain-containing protein n=1 Tax=Macrostomum lignano TaxID=282301 RepID=A0A1I8IYV3_9PLAT